MKAKIPILLITKDRPTLLEKVLNRIIKHTKWDDFDLWILDNLSSDSNKKIINMFKYKYPFINVYSSSFNQLALIQNQIIEKLKADFYIKIDDDILVSENWTDAFVGVYERNYQTMCFGSVTIPINGFGWIPFLETMGLVEDFKLKFPNVDLVQACMDVPVYNSKEVNEYIWNKCLNIDSTANTFISNQNGHFRDLICPHRYSIGAIVFSHKMWEQMGGWKVQNGYDLMLKRQKQYQQFAEFIKKFLKKNPTNPRLNYIADLVAGTAQGVLGLEEEYVYKYSVENGYTIPVTTQGIVFHFSFGPVDQYLMNTVYDRIAF